MMKHGFGQAHRATILCIDAYENGVPQGRFCHPGSEGCCSFRSLSQLLIQMEQALDAAATPQSFTSLRSFGAADTQTVELQAQAQEGLPTGALATFSLSVLFRQNASWQGWVRWLEGRQEQGFRSALELVFLINSALDNVPQSATA